MTAWTADELTRIGQTDELNLQSPRGDGSLGDPVPIWCVRPGDDHYAPDEQRRRAGARAGAEVAVLDGLGHWWFTHDPERSAAAINRFWAGAGQE